MQILDRRLSDFLRIHPRRRIRRRLELVRAEDTPFFAWPRHAQHQRYPAPRPLKIGHSNSVDSAFKRQRRLPGFRRMHAIVIHNLPAIYVKPGAIVRRQLKTIWPRLVDPEPAGVINGKPLASVCDTGESFLKISRRDVEGCGVDHPKRMEPPKIRKGRGIRANEIDHAKESTRRDHGGSKPGNSLFLGGGQFIGRNSDQTCCEKGSSNRQPGRAHTGECITGFPVIAFAMEFRP